MALDFVTSENGEVDSQTFLEEEISSENRGEDSVLRERARNELMGIFPKTNLKSQTKVVRQLCAKYLDPAIDLVRKNIPITMQNLLAV